MKVLGTMMLVLVLGFATGCPEGDDDSDADCHPACATGYVCSDSHCVPEGSDADADDNGADGDADTTETEDGTTTDEGTANCSWVAGTWEFTKLPIGVLYTLSLDQDGCHLTGEIEDATYTGEINEDDSLSLVYDTGTFREDLTGNLVGPTRMTGNWSRSTGPSGTWEADLQ